MRKLCLSVSVRRFALALTVAVAALAIVGLDAPPAAAADPVLRLHIKGAGTVTEVTSARRMNCTAPASTPAGVEGALCPVSYGWGWVVELKPTPAPGYVFDGWVGVADPKSVRCDPTRFSDNCKFQIWENLGLEARFVDTTRPDTTITGGPSGTTGSTSAAFTFASNQDASTFECRFDNGGFAPCTSGQTFSGFAEGGHTIEVRAIDPSGFVDDSPASRTWAIDTTGPTAVITSGPRR